MKRNIIKRNHFTISLFMILILFQGKINSQGSSKDSKFQIKIEEEIEEGIRVSGEEKEKENIIVSGEDEKLIRTFKDDTTFVSPTDESAVKWLEDKQILNKDGKTSVKETEKNGEILAAYGLYDNSLLFVNLVKSDKFGLYRLQYLRNDTPAESYNDSAIDNSNKSMDNVNISIGSRLSPFYTLMFNTRYQGVTFGLQDNSVYTEAVRRWGYLSFKNQIKPDSKQYLNADIYADYVDSGYTDLSGLEDNISYVNTGGDIQWVFIFDNKMSFEALGHYDYLHIDNISSNENQASTINFMGLFHWPIVKTFTGPSKGTSWQLNFAIGAGGYYREGIEVAPTGQAYIENRLGMWYSRLSGEKKLKYPDLRDPVYFSYFTRYEFYDTPEDYWDIFWENSLTISKDHLVRLKTGYKIYEKYFNPVLSDDDLYTFLPESYEEFFVKAGWEFVFLKNFLIEASANINYGITEVNMKPLYEFIFSIGYDSERFDGGISLKGVGRKKLDLETIGDYYILDANFKYWINPTFSLVLRGENLLNQKYIEYYPYLNSGIKIFLGCYIKI